MPVLDTLSKRLARAANAGKQEVYQYDDLPSAFRVQICHIWGNTIGPSMVVDGWRTPPPSNRAWMDIHNTMAKELGVFTLGDRLDDPFVQCQKFVQKATTLQALDLIELTFRVMPAVWNQWAAYDTYERSQIVTQSPDDAVAELNARFREHRIGYQFEGGQLIRVDSQYIHREIVTPAVQLLHDAAFHGASQEFLRAHEHYRAGRFKEAINEALKAFESTMKTICDKRRWAYPTNATAQALIDVIFAQNLIPSELTSEFTALRSLLESGLPTIRNRKGAHGQGANEVAVPDYLAGYALHLAASNIVVLVSAHHRAA